MAIPLDVMFDALLFHFFRWKNL